MNDVELAIFAVVVLFAFFVMTNSGGVSSIISPSPSPVVSPVGGSLSPTVNPYCSVNLCAKSYEINPTAFNNLVIACNTNGGAIVCDNQNTLCQLPLGVYPTQATCDSLSALLYRQECEQYCGKYFCSPTSRTVGCSRVL